MGLWKILIRLLNNFILERIAIKISSNIIAVSPVIVNQIPIKHRTKVNLIFPHGNLPIPDYKSDFYLEHIKESNYFPSKYALIAGYLDDRKRVDLILRSWKSVPEDLSLIVVGNGPNYYRLKSLSSQLELSNRVFFTGRIHDDQLSKLVAGSLFGIMASEREGFPTFIIECLKMGIPSIFFISTGESVYGQFAGKYLEVKELGEPRKISSDINEFIVRTLPVNCERVKEWGLSKFGLNDEILEALFRKTPANDQELTDLQINSYDNELH